jgi:hypothetical protein
MSFIVMRQLNALWVLAWALVKHLLLKPFVRRRGPAPWLARIAEESLGPVPPDAWRLFAGTSLCIGCSLCDTLGELQELPSSWIAAVARQPADAGLALHAADRLEALAQAIARICPARVPVNDVVKLIRDNHRMLVSR